MKLTVRRSLLVMVLYHIPETEQPKVEFILEIIIGKGMHCRRQKHFHFVSVLHYKFMLEWLKYN